MSERGIQLRQTADRQIFQLLGLVSSGGSAALSLPCPGREKLGNGTVAACAVHTANNYLRIAGFLQAASQTPGAPTGTAHGRHQIPRLPLALDHRPRGHAESGADQAPHRGDYMTPTIDLDGLLERLSAGRDALNLLADLTDEQLDTVPPNGSFKFCDGQRTLEQVVASILKHQNHQLEAIKAAVS